MTSTAEIRAAIATLRSQAGLVAARNGLTTAVVDSWLTAVEEQCAQAVPDEAAVRVCLRVLERWVSPVKELAPVHACLVRLPATGKVPLTGYGTPPSTKGWLPPVPVIGDGIALAST